MIILLIRFKIVERPTYIKDKHTKNMQSTKRPGESDTAYMLRNIGMAATACCIAEVATIPIDSVKVRL